MPDSRKKKLLVMVNHPSEMSLADIDQNLDQFSHEEEGEDNNNNLSHVHNSIRCQFELKNDKLVLKYSQPSISNLFVSA